MAEAPTAVQAPPAPRESIKTSPPREGEPKIDYCYEVTKDVPNIYFELAGTADDEVLEKAEVLKNT